MELLAPAGDYTAFLAAVNNGADAVYLGGPCFHARKSAANFSMEDLTKAVSYSKEHGKKIYVAVNTLIGNQEMEAVLAYVYELYRMQVDAVIVQDIGLMRALAAVLPEMKVHASTQATIHNADGINLLQALNVKRAVLARELSYQAMEAMRLRQQNEIEWEVFVHGALCYAYSGQCLMSSLLGARSGNRGQCAQPCRLPYQLHSKESRTPLKTPGEYLLSTADLCLLDQLPLLQNLKVSALKIEGRMKRAEYVAVVTRIYREALNRLADNLSQPEPTPLSQVFNRTLTSGYLLGSNRVLRPLRPDNCGEIVGRVVYSSPDRWEILLSQRVSRQDGLSIRDEAGLSICAVVLQEIYKNHIAVETAEAGDTITVAAKVRGVPIGSAVYRTYHHILNQSVKPALREQKPPTKGLTIRALIKIGFPLSLQGEDQAGNTATVTGKILAEPAKSNPLTREAVREKLARLGNTPYHLTDCIIDLEEAALIPFSELNRLRRELIEKLEAQSLTAASVDFLERTQFRFRQKSFFKAAPETLKTAFPALSVLVKDIESVKAAGDAGADIVYLDLAFLPKAEQKALPKLQEAWADERKKLILALPPIRHDYQDQDLKKLAQDRKTNFLVSNWGDLQWAKEQRQEIWVNDNLAGFNQVSFDWIRRYAKVQSLCLSPELTWDEIQGFSDLHLAECIIHGEILLMVSRACLLNNHLGKEQTNCSQLCGRNQTQPAVYYLRDRKGYEFLLQNSRSCLQYVYNARTHCLIEYIERFLSAGFKALRIEARSYTPRQTEAVTGIYRQAFDCFASGKPLKIDEWKKELLRVSNSPFTNGHYFRGV